MMTEPMADTITPVRPAHRISTRASATGMPNNRLPRETLSTADLTAYGTGKNWLTAIAGGIDSLLGAGGSAEKKGGTADNAKTQTVTARGGRRGPSAWPPTATWPTTTG